MPDLITSTTSANFEKHFEIAQRKYDGLYNLWEKQLSLESNPEEISWAWCVIGVYKTEEAANQAREARRREIEGA